jgi:selenide,water dikinase
LPAETDLNVIVGRDTNDDAGVYRLTEDLALVQTLDFFTPIVNDPYDFGRIAAANALSDVYAMGGRPITAMNIVCFPVQRMDKEILREILRGGMEKVHEAGAALVGGHSVDDVELKYGLSITGVVSPKRVLTNAGAQPGDLLILTKPLGTGILATAVKAGLASPQAQKRAIEVMATLNKTAAEVMMAYPVHACTDITGFGLLGHGLEMALASKVTLSIDSQKIPLLPEVFDHTGMGLVPAGSYANLSFCSHQVHQSESVDPILLDIIADAQTSGGLLIAVLKEHAQSLLNDLKAHGVEDAALIGEALDRSEGVIALQ